VQLRKSNGEVIDDVQIGRSPKGDVRISTMQVGNKAPIIFEELRSCEVIKGTEDERKLWEDWKLENPE